MAKLLKPLVVIVLLVSIAALVIQAAVLFPKRTLIKERTQKLEGGLDRVVATLKGPQSLLTDEIKAQSGFSAKNLVIGDKIDLPRLDSELNKANQVANAVLQGWQFTQTDLENTRQDLENTRAELESTKAQLEDARTQIVQLNETIRGKDQELLEKSNVIAGLQDQVAQLEEDKSVLEVQLEKCDKELHKEITMKPGTTGTIVYANKDWNFVVIDIGSNDGVQSTAEMIIHREDNMIGKIRLSAVRDNVTIAEVLPAYQKATVKEGDDVLY